MKKSFCIWSLYGVNVISSFIKTATKKYCEMLQISVLINNCKVCNFIILSSCFLLENDNLNFFFYVSMILRNRINAISLTSGSKYLVHTQKHVEISVIPNVSRSAPNSLPHTLLMYF